MIGLGSVKKNCVITQMQWKRCAIRPDPDSSSGCLHRKVFAAGKQTKVWGNHSDSTKGTKVRKSCLSVPRALDIAILIKCPKVLHLPNSSVQNHKGSHPERKVQFFWTLFKRPLTPPLPPPFVWTSCGEFFKKRFWALKMVVIYNGQNELPTFKMLYKCRC